MKRKATPRKRQAKRKASRKPQIDGASLEGDDLLERFGRYLQHRRYQARLSMRQFALTCDVPFSNVFQYERACKNPKLTDLMKMARGLKEPVVEFLRPLFGKQEFPPLTEKRILRKRSEAEELAPEPTPAEPGEREAEVSIV